MYGVAAETFSIGNTGCRHSKPVPSLFQKKGGKLRGLVDLYYKDI